MSVFQWVSLSQSLPIFLLSYPIATMHTVSLLGFSSFYTANVFFHTYLDLCRLGPPCGPFLGLGVASCGRSSQSRQDPCEGAVWRPYKMPLSPENPVVGRKGVWSPTAISLVVI